MAEPKFKNRLVQLNTITLRPRFSVLGMHSRRGRQKPRDFVVLGPRHLVAELEDP